MPALAFPTPTAMTSTRTPVRTPVASFVRRALLPAAAAAVIAAAVAPVALASAQAAPAFPQPKLFPAEWEFDFDSRAPKRIVVDGTAYWYMTYTVTNNTDTERAFIPTIDLVTRDGQVLRANRGVPSSVYEEISKRFRSDELTPPRRIYRLLLGDDQRVTTVAAWKEPMAEMGTFDVFIGGLSGEIVRLKDANGNELTNSDGEPILVRKTKQLRYKVRGDDIPSERPDPIVPMLDTWVMR